MLRPIAALVRQPPAMPAPRRIQSLEPAGFFL
jgi:hypothetical protein